MGEIDEKYAQPGMAERLGARTGTEMLAPDGGRLQRYARGLITWHRMAGARAVHGEVVSAYLESGGPDGPLGYPTRDEEPVWGHRGGVYQDFMDGQIYAQPELGAHAISGGIFEMFLLHDALGGPGYPVSRRRVEDDGTVRQDFEHQTLSWHPDLGVSSQSRRRTGRKFLRVIPVAFRDIPPPTGLTRRFLEEYFFGRGINLRMPDGGRLRESIAEYFDRISGGRLMLEGVVEEWYQSPRDCQLVAHWTPGGTWPPGDAGLTGVFIDAIRHVGIRDEESLRVRGRAVDGLYFLHTDMLANGGVTRALGDMKQNLAENDRLDLWDSAWDSLTHVGFCSSSITRQTRQDINPQTSTFDEPPLPGEIEHARQSTLRHELVHLLGPFGGDIYGAPWGFDATWHEVMSYGIGTDAPVGITSLVGERLGYLAPSNVARRSTERFELAELDAQRAAARFPNGPQGDPEYLVLEHRRRWDFEQVHAPAMPNGIVAYAIDPRGRRVIDVATPRPMGRIEHRGARYIGGLIRRNGHWGSAFGVDAAGRRLAHDGPPDRNTLNHAGEAWWMFDGFSPSSGAPARFSATYLGDDLVARHDDAKWTEGAGPAASDSSTRHLVALLERSSLTSPTGERLGRTLAVRPAPDRGVTGVYTVRVPESGGRLHLSAVLGENPVGATGMLLRVSFTGPFPATSSRFPVELAAVELKPGARSRKLVVDLNAYSGRSIRLAIAVARTGGMGQRGTVEISEATIVPTARVVDDLLERLDTATFEVGPTARRVALGDDTGSAGAARRDRQIDLHDGRTYATTSLHLHPQWTDDGWIEAAWRLTLPATEAVLRFHAGFDARRSVVANGVVMSIGFRGSAGTTTLLGDSNVDRAPVHGRRGLVRNRPLTTAIPIPSELRSQTGTLRVRVGADGNSGQDWFHLVSARITAN